MALSKPKKDSYTGLKVGNISEINITLFCELCGSLQLHPMQLLCCGTRLCRYCATVGVPDR